jgi:hypothetical protein
MQQAAQQGLALRWVRRGVLFFFFFLFSSFSLSFDQRKPITKVKKPKKEERKKSYIANTPARINAAQAFAALPLAWLTCPTTINASIN